MRSVCIYSLGNGQFTLCPHDENAHFFGRIEPLDGYTAELELESDEDSELGLLVSRNNPKGDKTCGFDYFYTASQIMAGFADKHINITRYTDDKKWQLVKEN